MKRVIFGLFLASLSANVVALTPVSVPESSSLMLFIVGALGFLAARRNK